MGKKTRREREERRDSYAAMRGKSKRKNMLIASGIMAGIAAIVIVTAYVFVTEGPSTPGGPQGAGTLGDEHEHASILVKIFGDTFDFSGPSYQVQSSWIHFESQDGATIHRHASGVTMGYLFDTIGITIDEECYRFPPSDGRRFCTDGENTLKYYINGESVPSITDHVLDDLDRILITYGSESDEVIEGYLAELDAQPILA